MGFRSGPYRKPPAIPTVVMECGVSEAESDLGLDARQWLLRSLATDTITGDHHPGVKCVVLVKILEGPKLQGMGPGSQHDINHNCETDTDCDNADGPEVLSGHDSDDSTMVLYKHVEAQFVASPGLTAVWAGEFTAWIEVWRMDSNGAIKLEDRITLLPVVPSVELVLRRSDFGLPSQEGQQNELRVPLEPLVSDLARHARSGLAYSRWVRKRGPLHTGDFN